MEIVKMRANHVETPLGYALEPLRLSWKVEDSRGKKQEKACVKIAEDALFQNILYHSGYKELNNLCVAPGIQLKPRKRYYWSVQVWSDAGETAGATSWFETGKQTEAWQASWIAPPKGRTEHPLLRGSFSLEAPVRSARAYVCGLGLYEFFVNGEKAGQEYFTPGYNDYTFWKQVQTYDVTQWLHKGENRLGCMLGNGWYKGRFGFEENADRKELFGDRFAFLCELHVKLENGKEVVLGSGRDWEWKPSPVLESGIYDGERYDARLETENWCLPESGQEGWMPAELWEPDSWTLEDRRSLPVEITKRLPVKELIHTPKGEWVLDFGQEITGWVEFTCDLPSGKAVWLQYGEILQDGCFYRENLRSAKAEYTYISRGEKAQVRPHFTFYGFRYVKVEGMEAVNPEAFTACVLHSKMDFTGKIHTSDPKVNRLFQNALWSQRGNFVDVPTDCPQRDERMGWTGDAQVFAPTASFNMYTPAFYAKYMWDMLKEQTGLYGGSVPHTVPMMIEDLKREAHGSCAWADAAIFIPWTLYLFYGDTVLLEQQYANMVEWGEYLIREDQREGGRHLRQTGFHFGDWLALDAPDRKENSVFGGTDVYFVASAYYYRSIFLLAQAAQVLEKKEDARKYKKLAGEILQAFRAEYLLEDGKARSDTQTAYVLLLQFEMLQPEEIPGAVENLRRKLRESQMHLTTGFVGTPYLCPALSENGAQEDACTLLLNQDYPSWLYEVNMGATTIWERWNSVLPDGHVSDTGMNSLNHYAYGSIVEWMYRYLCGINPSAEMPGFRKICFTPLPDPRFRFAEATFDSPMGLCRSQWRYEGDRWLYTCTVPFGAEAELVLPMEGTLKGEDGQPRTGKRFFLHAGTYEFRANL